VTADRARRRAVLMLATLAGSMLLAGVLPWATGAESTIRFLAVPMFLAGLMVLGVTLRVWAAGRRPAPAPLVEPACDGCICGRSGTCATDRLTDGSAAPSTADHSAAPASADQSAAPTTAHHSAAPASADQSPTPASANRPVVQASAGGFAGRSTDRAAGRGEAEHAAGAGPAGTPARDVAPQSVARSGDGVRPAAG
jgi:hypothetical protein